MKTKNNHKFIIIGCVFMLSVMLMGCAQNGYIKYYQSYEEEVQNTQKDIENKNVEVYSTSRDRIVNDVRDVRRRNYLVTGEASFVSSQ